jgi:hypothetical protein
MRVRSRLSPGPRRGTRAMRSEAGTRRRSEAGAPAEAPGRSLGGVAVSAGVTAVVTLVVTALLTPLGSGLARVAHDVFGGAGAESKADPEKKTIEPEVPLERAADPTGALSMLVPTTWGVTRAEVDTPFGVQDADHPGPTDFVGAAMSAGDKAGLSNTSGWDGSYAYFSASRDAAVRLGLVGAGADELTAWTEHFVRSWDWTVDGCTFAGEEHPGVEGYVTTMRRWEDCKGLPDVTFWELAAARDDGAVVALVQLQRGEVPEGTAAEMMTSFSVAAEHLPEPGPSAEVVLP